MGNFESKIEKTNYILEEEQNTIVTFEPNYPKNNFARSAMIQTKTLSNHAKSVKNYSVSS